MSDDHRNGRVLGDGAYQGFCIRQGCGVPESGNIRHRGFRCALDSIVSGSFSGTAPPGSFVRSDGRDSVLHAGLACRSSKERLLWTGHLRTCLTCGLPCTGMHLVRGRPGCNACNGGHGGDRYSTPSRRGDCYLMHNGFSVMVFCHRTGGSGGARPDRCRRHDRIAVSQALGT